MSQLTEAEIHTLNEALDDEYLAWATYDQVIADFGDVSPFNNIREAEARHIEALCTLFAHYASLQAACEAGIAAEIVNGEMYERLLGATQRPEILTVLRNLQEASQQRHLAAFQHCAQRPATGSGGRGAERHMGGHRGRRGRS